MHLVLLGYRGCGKSSVGRLLAERLGRPFVDLDDVTRAAFGGRTVADIWANEGQPAFRQAEVNAACEQITLDAPQVLALGGGTPMQQMAFEAIQKSAQAFCVYLQGSPETLAARIDQDPNTGHLRPSLVEQPETQDTQEAEDAATGAVSSDATLTEVRQVLSQREATYQSLADATVAIDGLGLQAVVDAVASVFAND